MNIKKIIREEMDWADDIQHALPDRDFLEEKVPVTISISDYLTTKYSYNFIDVILEDGRVIELKLEGDWDVKYDTYNSLWELTKEQGLSTSWDEEEPTEFNQAVMEEYLREFNMEEVDSEVDSILRKAIPLDIKGIYLGHL